MRRRRSHHPRRAFEYLDVGEDGLIEREEHVLTVARRCAYRMRAKGRQHRIRAYAYALRII